MPWYMVFVFLCIVVVAAMSMSTVVESKDMASVEDRFKLLAVSLLPYISFALVVISVAMITQLIGIVGIAVGAIGLAESIVFFRKLESKSTWSYIDFLVYPLLCLWRVARRVVRAFFDKDAPGNTKQDEQPVTNDGSAEAARIAELEQKLYRERERSQQLKERLNEVQDELRREQGKKSGFRAKTGSFYDDFACSNRNDAWMVFGLSPGSSKDEVSARYKVLAREYHPDRVASLGSQVKEYCGKKMVQINRAYELLKS